RVSKLIGHTERAILDSRIWMVLCEYEPDEGHVNQPTETRKRRPELLRAPVTPWPSVTHDRLALPSSTRGIRLEFRSATQLRVPRRRSAGDPCRLQETLKQCSIPAHRESLAPPHEGLVDPSQMHLIDRDMRHHRLGHRVAHQER